MLIPTIIMVGVFLPAIAYIVIGESIGAITYSCTREVTVADILRVDYRSATILTTDQEEIILNQETFTVGDTLCVKTKRTTDWSKI